MTTDTMNSTSSRMHTRDIPDEQLTSEQLYQRNYHRANKQSRADARAERRKTDKAFRMQDIERLRQRRADRRKAVADNKFKALVTEKRDKSAPTRRPRLVEIQGKRVYVFGTGTLAREVGREDATIRAWLAQGVLPGASVWIGRRAQFTPGYCAAVRSACQELLTQDGRGALDILHKLIRSKFKEHGISYVRKGSKKRQRS